MSSPYPTVPQPAGPTEAPYASWNGGTPAQPRPPQRKARVWLHVTLFVLTAASTWMVGGAPYAISLLVILTAHEFGHYFAARHYRVKATLPYFIPFPPLGGVPTLGTLGAVIRMSPYIPNRRALFDIAAAGPIAGLIVALPVSFIGIALSERIADPGQMEHLITLGDPLLFQAMEWMLFGARGDNADLVLHSMGFAGWVGLFVTALNLLPISQLDGGHINYAIFGGKSRLIAGGAFLTLAVTTFIMGFHYSVILVLLWFMGIGHPPTLNDGLELGRTRRIVGALLLLVFILCFTPSPFQV
jgi:membrane-associated protease RseP (regulator of RpoE activity)